MNQTKNKKIFNNVIKDLLILNELLDKYIKTYYIIYNELETNINEECLLKCNKLIIKKNNDNNEEQFFRLMQKCR